MKKRAEQLNQMVNVNNVSVAKHSCVVLNG